MNSIASFPILDFRMILEHLRELPLNNILEEDLIHPTTNKVIYILECYMSLILGLTLEDIEIAVRDQLDIMEYPDIYQEAMKMAVFEIAMNQLLKRAAIDHFSLKDLTAPDSIRFKRILSGLINFRLFEQEQAAEYYTPVQQEDEHFEKQEHVLLQKNHALREDIANLLHERKENEPRVEEFQQKISQTKEEMRQMKQTATELQERLDAAKIDSKIISTQANEAAESNRQQEAELSRLRSRLLRSPERIRSTIMGLQATLEREKDNVAGLEKKERELVGKLSSLKKYQSDLSQCIKIMDEWEIDQGKLLESTKRYEAHVELLETLRAEADEYESKIAVLLRRIAILKDELARLHDKTEKKRVGSKQRIKMLNESHAQLNEQRRGLELQADSKLKEVLELEREIVHIHQETHEELEKHEAGFKSVQDQITIFSIKLNKAFDSLNAVNAESVGLY